MRLISRLLSRVKILTWVGGWLMGIGLLFLAGASSVQAAPNDPQYRINSYNLTFVDDSAVGGGRSWRFNHLDSNGGELQISTSLTGDLNNDSDWSVFDTTSVVAQNFAVAYHQADGTPYVVMAYECNNYDICVLIGEISYPSGTPHIAWHGPPDAFNGSSSTDLYLYPSVAVGDDASIWVAAVHQTGEPYITNKVPPDPANYQQAVVVNSGAGVLPIGPAVTFSAPTSVNRATSFLNQLLLTNLNGKMHLFLNGDQGLTKNYQFNSGAWTEMPSDNYDWLSLETEYSLFNSSVKRMVVYNGELVVAGVNIIGGQQYTGLVRWNGSTWSNFSNKNVNVGYDMYVYQGKLYVSGYANEVTDEMVIGVPGTAGIVAWNGTSWESVGGGVTGKIGSHQIHVMDFFEHNNLLYVGGQFGEMGGVLGTSAIAIWDGSNWSALGSGNIFDDNIRAVEVYQGQIVVAGDFNSINGDISKADIATWDGSNWQQFGGGLAINGNIEQLLTFNNELYMTGYLYGIGGDSSLKVIVKWDGSSWQSIPGLSDQNNAYVDLMTIYNNKLIVAGLFDEVNGVIGTKGIAVWDGSNWSAMGSGFDLKVTADMTSVEYNGELFFGGRFTKAGGVGSTYNLAVWDGSSWQPFVRDPYFMPSSAPNQLQIKSMVSDGSKIYVGGNFMSVQDVPNTSFLAAWNGNGWESVGDVAFAAGVYASNSIVSKLLIWNNKLYVMGWFDSISGLAGTAGIAAYDLGTQTWEAVSTTILPSWQWLTNGYVFNNELYVSGFFGVNGATNIAVLRGGDWQALDPTNYPDGYYLRMVKYNSQLIVAGNFNSIGSIADTRMVAAWDGSNWSALGQGLNGGYTLNALEVFNNEVYVGGNFTDASGVANTNYLAKWDGSNWQPAFDPSSVTLYGDINFLKAVNGKLYISSSNGQIHVLQNGQTFSGNAIVWNGVEFEFFQSNSTIGDLIEHQGRLAASSYYSYSQLGVNYLSGSILSFLSPTLFDFQVVNGLFGDRHSPFLQWTDENNLTHFVYIYNGNFFMYYTYNSQTNDLVSLGSLSYLGGIVTQPALYFKKSSNELRLNYHKTDNNGITTREDILVYALPIINTSPTLTLDNPTQDYFLIDPSQVGLPGFETATSSVKFTGTLGDDDDGQQLNLKLELPSLISGIPNLIKSIGPVSTPATSSAWEIELTYEDLHIEDPTNPGTYVYPYGTSISNLSFDLTDGVETVAQVYSGVIALNQELLFKVWNASQDQGARVDAVDPINNPGSYLNFFGSITDLEPGKTLTLTASFSGISNPDVHDGVNDGIYTYQTTFTAPLHDQFWSFSIPANYLGVGSYGSLNSSIPFILTDGANTLVTYVTGAIVVSAPSTANLTPGQIDSLYKDVLTAFAGAIYFPTGSTPNLVDPTTQAIVSPATSPVGLTTDSDQYYCHTPGCFESSSTPLTQLWQRQINGLDYPFMVKFYNLPQEKDELRLLDTGW